MPGQTPMVQKTAALLNTIGMFEERYAVIRSVCGRIKAGLRDLSYHELVDIQEWCKRFADSHSINLYTKPNKLDNDSANKMRKKIIYYAHLMQWQINGGKADMKRIDSWCIHSGKYKKALMEHNETELTLLVGQFEKVYQSFLKGLSL